MKNIYWIIGVIFLLGILYWAYSKGKLNKIITSLGGSARVSAEGEESDGMSCGGSTQKSTLDVCSKPLFQVVGKVKEMCWTEESLGFVPGSGTTLKKSDGQKYYFNRQNVDKYCFVNSKEYPLFICDKNNPGHDTDGNVNQNCSAT